MKNLLRQNFIQSDVGKNKAEVLAQRYGRAYGVNIVPIVKRVAPGRSGYESNLFNDLDAPPQYPGENSLVIMCVDSAQARRDILQTWSSDRMRSSTYRHRDPVTEVLPVFIDAGNEDDFGQVRIFQRALITEMSSYEIKDIKSDLPKMRPEIVDIHCLPMDVKFYENLRDNEGGSCADLDQTLAINALMATLIMGMVQNLYYLKPFTYHSMGISLSGGVSVEHLTAEYISGIGVSSSKANSVVGEIPVMSDSGVLLDSYINRNVAALRRMGLNSDGTPLPVATAAAEAESDTSTDEEGEGSVEEAESGEVSSLGEGEVSYVPPASLGSGYVVETERVGMTLTSEMLERARDLLSPEATPSTWTHTPIVVENTTVAPESGIGVVSRELADSVRVTAPVTVPIIPGTLTAAGAMVDTSSPPPLRPGLVTDTSAS